jgi:hypothetical protein
VIGKALVSLHDLTATFLAYAGTSPLSVPPSGLSHDRWVSRSLRDLLEDPHEFTNVTEVYLEVVQRLRGVLEDARSDALS